MTSNTIKTRIKRNQKGKPNKRNIKEDMKRIKKNEEILRELALKDKEA